MRLKRFLLSLLAGFLAFQCFACPVFATEIDSLTQEEQEIINSFFPSETEQETIVYELSDIVPRDVMCIEIDGKKYLSFKNDDDVLNAIRNLDSNLSFGIQINRVTMDSELRTESWESNINDYTNFTSINEIKLDKDNIDRYFFSEISENISDGLIVEIRYVSYDANGNIVDTSAWSNFAELTGERVSKLNNLEVESPISINKAQIIYTKDKYMVEFNMSALDELKPYLALPGSIVYYDAVMSIDDSVDFSLGNGVFAEAETVSFDITEKVYEYTSITEAVKIPCEIKAKINIASNLGNYEFKYYCNPWIREKMIDVEYDNNIFTDYNETDVINDSNLVVEDQTSSKVGTALVLGFIILAVGAGGFICVNQLITNKNKKATRKSNNK